MALALVSLFGLIADDVALSAIGLSTMATGARTAPAAVTANRPAWTLYDSATMKRPSLSLAMHMGRTTSIRHAEDNAPLNPVTLARVVCGELVSHFYP